MIRPEEIALDLMGVEDVFHTPTARKIAALIFAQGDKVDVGGLMAGTALSPMEKEFLAECLLSGEPPTEAEVDQAVLSARVQKLEELQKLITAAIKHEEKTATGNPSITSMLKLKMGVASHLGDLRASTPPGFSIAWAPPLVRKFRKHLGIQG